MIVFVSPALAQGTGTITGVVLSAGSHSVPDAVVTLYDMDGNLVYVPDNPQLSSNGTGTNAGIYTFYDVPPGTYNVTAARGDAGFFAIVDLREGTATANIVLPEYAEAAPAYQLMASPTPTPKPFYYYVPVHLGTAPGQQLPNEGLPIGMAVVGGIGAMLLLARRKGAA